MLDMYKYSIYAGQMFVIRTLTGTAWHWGMYLEIALAHNPCLLQPSNVHSMRRVPRDQSLMASLARKFDRTSLELSSWVHLAASGMPVETSRAWRRRLLKGVAEAAKSFSEGQDRPGASRPHVHGKLVIKRLQATFGNQQIHAPAFASG